MRRGKIVIKKIKEKIKRQVTFAKRRKGLLKKVHELSVLCDAQIALILFSENHKLYHFSSHSTNIDNIIIRYQMAMQQERRHECTNCVEIKEALKREIETLKLNLELYGGQNLTLLTFDHLIRLELQLESSLHNLRARKFELMQQQQAVNLKGKEILTDEEEIQQFYHPMMEQGSSSKQVTWQTEKHPMMAFEKEGDNDDIQQVKMEFPFHGDQQPPGVLQLVSTLLPPPQIAPAQAQAQAQAQTQPNFHDFILHRSTSS